MSLERVSAVLRESLAPLHHLAYSRFLVAQTISMIGTVAARVALIWYVLQDLRESAALGLVLLAFTAPQFFVSIIGGVLADRYDRKTIAVSSDFASAGIFFAMWLLAVQGALTLAHLIGLLILAGVSTSVFGPSAGAMIPQLVERTSVRQANALKLLSDQFAGIVAPALAGFTLAVIGAPTWFLVNAVSFALAAVLFLPIRVAPVKPPESKMGLWRVIVDVHEGVKTIGRLAWLRAGVLAGGLANLLVVAPLMVLIPAIVEQQHLGPEALGLYFTVFSLGWVMGIVLVGSLASERYQLEVALGSLIMSGALVAGLGLFPMLIPLLGFGWAIGVGFAVYEVLWNAYEQTNVSDSILARVLAGDAWLSFVARSAGLALVGVSAGASQASMTLVFCGGLFALAMVLLWLQVGRGGEILPIGEQ